MDLEKIVSKIENNYEAEEFAFNKQGLSFPSRAAIIDIIKGLRQLVFPGYFDDVSYLAGDYGYHVGDKILYLRNRLYEQVRAALLYVKEDVLCEDNRYMESAGALETCSIEQRAGEVCDAFFERLPYVQEMLLKDVQAAYDGDPAAQSKQEIILSYPGFFAIFIYRFAHELYLQKIPLIPRLMTEYAHSGSGVDINAGATIGEYFFIDHATGVVIGETTVIGNHVKLYQGVTLGALSTRAGQALSGVKRHPTIEDGVVIYSNASVLGGETVIGENAVIGGSAFITSSVPKNTTVSVKTPELTMKTPQRS